MEFGFGDFEKFPNLTWSCFFFSSLRFLPFERIDLLWFVVEMFIFRFQASGDHLPQAPPAPAHATLAAQQAAQYNAQAKSYDLGADGFDDGQYDPRYNDPNFSGNLGGHYTPPAPQPAPYVAQPQPAPQPQPQPQQPQYNQNYIAQYQPTTQNPHRFQPPGNYNCSFFSAHRSIHLPIYLADN